MYKSFILFAATFGLFLFAQCGFNTDPEITVSDAVLKNAKTEKFDYLETLEKAKKGDVAAIKLFLDYNRFADGVDGFDHGLTCLELLPFAGDANTAAACSGFKPGMKKLLVERLTFAQTRTKKKDLKAPLTQWVPATMASLTVPEPVAVVDSTGAAIAPVKPLKVINTDSLAKARSVKK